MRRITAKNQKPKSQNQILIPALNPAKKGVMPANPHKQITRIFMRWLPVMLCMGFIFLVSSMPGRNIPSLFPFQAVAYHLCIYCLLAYFFAHALKNTFSHVSKSSIIMFAVLFGVIYGLSDEWHQASVPYRSVSGLDVLTDGIGSLIGSLIPFVRIPRILARG